MEIVRYRQFSKDDHEKIMKYLNLLFEEKWYVDVIELDNTLIVEASEYDDCSDWEKRVEFFPFSEEAKIAEKMNKKEIVQIKVYRCTYGYLVVQFLEFEEDNDKFKDYTIPYFIVFVLVLLGIFGGLMALIENADRWLFQ